MPRKLIRRYLPSHDSVRSNRFIAAFGSLLHHHNLWHLHRHSTAGGVAVGMFAGLIPGPLQILTAAILSILFRVNLPVAVITTLYTNPFTIVPLYLAAYEIGALVTGEGKEGRPRVFSHEGEGLFSWIPALVDWVMSLGKPLLVGLPLLALGLAALGYVVVLLGWRLHVVWEWRRRRRRRQGGHAG